MVAGGTYIFDFELFPTSYNDLLVRGNVAEDAPPATVLVINIIFKNILTLLVD